MHPWMDRVPTGSCARVGKASAHRPTGDILGVGGDWIMAVQSRGMCRLCGQTFGKSQMTRHIKSCLRKKGEGDHLLISVQDASRLFWVYMILPQSTSLRKLDGILRDLWVECCGHLSAFSDGEVSYLDDPEPSLPWGRGKEKGMQVPLLAALQRTGKLKYEYDFGSTTELTIGLVGVDAVGGDQVLVARNDPPAIDCLQCGKPATVLVTEDWEPEPYCDSCWTGDEEVMMLPVVNSPRMGVCGYAGPSIEP